MHAIIIVSIYYISNVLINAADDATSVKNESQIYISNHHR